MEPSQEASKRKSKYAVAIYFPKSSWKLGRPIKHHL